MIRPKFHLVPGEQVFMRFRSSHALSLILACLIMAGCTTNANMVEEVLQPSMETTSSIARPSATIPQTSPGAVAQNAVTPPQAAPAAPLAIAPDTRPPVAEAANMQVAALPVPSTRPKQYKNRHRVYRQKFRDAKPINFGSSAPEKFAVHGVDVSRWQGDIDWQKLRRQGANFVYIKATDGGDHLDPMFKKNWNNAAKAGLKRGAYHFFYWCRTASSQAKWFIRNVPKVKGALPPVIDVEWNAYSSCKKRPPRETVLEKMRVFMDMLERHYGQRPVIYTAPDFYSDNLKGAFKNYPFWLRAVAQPPSKVYPGREWVFWQYSGSGLSQGVDGKIDLNVFYGSENDWNRWLARNSG